MNKVLKIFHNLKQHNLFDFNIYTYMFVFIVTVFCSFLILYLMQQNSIYTINYILHQRSPIQEELFDWNIRHVDWNTEINLVSWNSLKLLWCIDSTVSSIKYNKIHSIKICRYETISSLNDIIDDIFNSYSNKPWFKKYYDEKQNYISYENNYMYIAKNIDKVLSEYITTYWIPIQRIAVLSNVNSWFKTIIIMYLNIN